MGASLQLESVDGVQTRWMQSFVPTGSSAPPAVHFGIGGDVSEERSLHVVWPDGKTSVNDLETVGGLSSASYEVVVYRTD